MNKNYRKEQFTIVVLLSTIESVLSKRDFKKFQKWMNGQTAMMVHKNDSGIFTGDLYRFLEIKNNPEKLKELWD